MTDTPTAFDAYEIHGCMSITGNANFPFSDRDLAEQCDDTEAHFWSLFGHVTGEGLHCIGDFTSRDRAEEILSRIEGFDIDQALRLRRQIGIIWSIEDIQEVRPDLDEAQSWKVLQSCESQHDCERGISWESIEAVAEYLFPEPESNTSGE